MAQGRRSRLFGSKTASVNTLRKSIAANIAIRARPSRTRSAPTGSSINIGSHFLLQAAPAMGVYCCRSGPCPRCVLSDHDHTLICLRVTRNQLIPYDQTVWHGGRCIIQLRPGPGGRFPCQLLIPCIAAQLAQCMQHMQGNTIGR